MYKLGDEGWGKKFENEPEADRLTWSGYRRAMFEHLQRSQNKDALAIHLKLNEIVAALDGASNRLIGVEDMTEEEIRTLHQYYWKLAEMAKFDEKLTASHSIEEAQELHERKQVKRAEANSA